MIAPLLRVAEWAEVRIGPAAILATASQPPGARGTRRGLAGAAVQTDIEVGRLFHRGMRRRSFKEERPTVHSEVRAQPPVQEARAHVERPLKETDAALRKPPDGVQADLQFRGRSLQKFHQLAQ